MSGYDKLKEWMESPDYKNDVSKFVDNIIKREERLNRYINKIRTYIEPLSNAEFFTLINRLCEWEEKYEEIEYKKGRQSTSNLFYVVFKAISEKKNARPCKEDFLYEKYIYKGITFKLYIGQGSFYRISMGKRFIFQTK